MVLAFVANFTLPPHLFECFLKRWRNCDKTQNKTNLNGDLSKCQNYKAVGVFIEQEFPITSVKNIQEHV